MLQGGKGLSASALKYLACLFMLIDHIGYLLFPQAEILRIIGRPAFPIFAFMIANGYLHTKSPGRYLLRLAVFAAAFQWFYAYMMDDDRLSVLFTLATGLAAIWLADTLDKKIGGRALSYGCQLAIMAAAAVGAELADMEYGWYGVALICTAWLFFDRVQLLAIVWALLTGVFVFAFDGWILQLFAVLTPALLCFYNGKPGSGGKWFFYIFYAAHIAVLYLINVIAF